MVQAGGDGSGGRDGERGSTFPITSIASHEALEMAALTITQELLDDAILGVVFEVHRSLKRGLLMLEVGSPEEDQKYLQVTSDGLDVFGQAPVKKQQECMCPNCSRNLAASRFAPHLEKCMGMGRNSSRIASRRIQSNSRENNTGHGHASDEEDDDDWIIDRKRRRRDKNSPRRSKNNKMKNEGVSSSSSNSNNSNNANANVEIILNSGSLEEKKSLLSQICGVMSEHTGKMCTRSVRCPQHTSEQRRIVREQAFDGSLDGASGIGATSTTTTRAADSTTMTSSNLRSGIPDTEDIQVDIDCLDDGHLGSSWDHDLSNTTSPADSTSTNNSTSSLNRRSSSKNKKKSSKSSKSSNSSHSSLID